MRPQAWPPPTPNPRVEHFVQRLCNDRTWQERTFSPEEVEVMLDMADRYLRLQLQAGFNLEESYERVRAMLMAATKYEDIESDPTSEEPV